MVEIYIVAESHKVVLHLTYNTTTCPINPTSQRYNMLVMQCTKEHSELDINLDDATLEKEYNGDIQAHMDGSFSNLVAKTFKVITKKKVFIPGKFANSNQQACVKCALR